MLYRRKDSPKYYLPLILKEITLDLKEFIFLSYGHLSMRFFEMAVRYRPVQSTVKRNRIVRKYFLTRETNTTYRCGIFSFGDKMSASHSFTMVTHHGVLSSDIVEPHIDISFHCSSINKPRKRKCEMSANDAMISLVKKEMKVVALEGKCTQSLYTVTA